MPKHITDVKHYEPLEKLRNWLPENKDVRNALALHASGGQKLSTEEYQSIIDGLLGHITTLEKEAFIDPSTEHLNVNAYHAALKNIIEERLNNPTKQHEPVTIAVIDLNYLKPLNNVSYYGCGDVAIKYLTDFVSSKLKKGDLLTRLSQGDEFGVIMKNCTPEQAEKRLEPILHKIAKQSVGEENPCIGTNAKGDKTNIQVSAAFGCALLPNKPPAEAITSISNRTIDIKNIISTTLKIAGEKEKENKKSSKAYAASIKGGFPECDDRQNAEKIIGEFLQAKFNQHQKPSANVENVTSITQEQQSRTR